MKQFKSNNKVLIYFAVTFLATWLLWLPGVLASQTSVPIPKQIIFPLVILGTFVPSIVGYIFVKQEKQQGVFRRWFNTRLGWYWVPVILLLPLGGLGAYFVNWVISGNFPVEMPNIFLLPFQFIGIMLISGPVNEEFGWRGYALPQLQRHFNALTASLLLGVIWAFWHIPVFFITGAPQAQLPFLQFAITVIVVSILITWAQNNTQQSLLPALIIHTGINFTNEIFPLINLKTGNHTIWNYANIILAIVAIVIIWIYGAKTLSQKGGG